MDMDNAQKVTREALHAWAIGKDWLRAVTEKTRENYLQDNFLTPEGHTVYVIYDFEGYVKHMGTPPTVVIQQVPVPAGRSPLDLSGGMNFHPPR